MPVAHRVDIVGERFVEIVMARTGFMDYVTGEGPRRDEAVDYRIHVCQFASAVVAHVDYHPLRTLEVRQDIIHVSGADRRRKRRIVHIAYVLRQQSVGDRPERPVIEIQIILLYDSRIVVLGIIAPPFTIIGGGKRCRQVRVAVTQFAEHFGAQIEKLLAGHGVAYTRAVTGIYLVPVHTLFLKETIVFVEYGPEGIEIPTRIIVVLLDVVTRCKRHGGKQNRYDV